MFAFKNCIIIFDDFFKKMYAGYFHSFLTCLASTVDNRNLALPVTF